MSSFIHETAIVAPEARIGDGCHIGPYSIVGSDVVLAERVRLESHVVIDGKTTIGSETHVFPFACIGMAPQDLKYKGETTVTEIGERNILREYVTVHRGTTGGGGVTRVGNDNLLMAQAHVAHDCILGSGIIMANSASLAGHVRINDYATLGGLSGVHQFCRIGTGSLIGAFSIAVKDVLPYSTVQGNHARCFGTNKIGLKRRGHSREAIDAVRKAFRLLLSSKMNTTQAVERIRAEIAPCSEIDLLIDFIETSKRGVAL